MNKQVIKRLLRYLRPYRPVLILITIAAAISTIFTVVAPSVLGGITTTLYDGVTTGYFDWARIRWLLVALVAIYVIGQSFGYLQNFGITRIAALVVQTMRGEISRKMHRLKLGYYDARTHGEVLSVITNDVDSISRVISQNLMPIITQTVTAFGTLFMMLRINLWLTLVAIALVPVSLFCSRGVMRSSMKHYAEQQTQLGALNGLIEEMYQGQPLVQVYNYQDKACDRFEQLNRALQKSARSADVNSGLIMPIAQFVSTLGYVISAVLGCLFVLSGHMTVGNVQAMLQYSRSFSQPFASMAGMAGAFGAAAAAAKRVFDLLDAEEESDDPSELLLPQEGAGDVTMEHVRFGYSPNSLLMRDVNLSVEPGQKVAIVGPTGAGKTTLVNLLMRFYELDGGAIRLGGVRTQDMTRAALRSRFGMVLQDTWLFEGTIAENIAYSRDDMTKEEIVRAAEAASADAFIRTLPGGYDMVLTQGAENISQGERQLLTIARALASDPDIMILDEATSNVDTHTEQKIQQAMAALLRGRTSFVIAHRLSTIRDADVVLYMEHGDIVEVGNHDTLMALGGKYMALYQSQFE